MKFSIIVPVYNVENYILKCLNSINNQTYQNFEVIIVNDGSTDNSPNLIKKFIKDKSKFKYYQKANGGLSDARNFGINYVTGDYILFVDSDDYIASDLLIKLQEILEKKNYEIIKFNLNDVINNKVHKHFEKITQSQKINFEDIINFSYFEPACGYCYQTKFYLKHNYQFKKNRYHEDFGLIPLILLDAQEIYYLNFYGYYYVKREDSIVNNIEILEKKAYDTLNFSIENINKITKLNVDKSNKELILNFYAIGAISKAKNFKNTQFLKELKKAKLYKYLLSKTWKQKIKKIICMFNYKLFIKLFL